MIPWACCIQSILFRRFKLDQMYGQFSLLVVMIIVVIVVMLAIVVILDLMVPVVVMVQNFLFWCF